MLATRKATRRELLTGFGGLALGLGVGWMTGAFTSCSLPRQREVENPAATPPSTPEAVAATQAANVLTPGATGLTIPELPWPYVKLDPVTVAERSYDAYYKGGCMYGAYESIVGELRDKAGFPYIVLPTKMMAYGKAGVAGWGTLCGALNGATAAIYLVADPKIGDQMIDELYTWYGQTALPNYEPKNPKFAISTSVSASPLCHASVTRWCEATGFKALSPERAERCAWLTAAVAKYTVAMINNNVDGAFAISHPIPADVKGCLVCHGKGGTVENVHASKGVSCTQCHTDIPQGHPNPLKK